ncbi:MAG: clostripain-related cysteine peptidase, partial [Candidatus Hermodarchaeota archaeon]
MSDLVKNYRDLFSEKGKTISLPQPKKEWTFLVYLAGDNNLESAGIDDINEMEQAGGSSNKVNVVVQFDRILGYDLGNADWITTKRFYIKKGESSYKIESIEIEDLGETNTGDPKVLEDFLNWGIENFPAKHYALVLWNHGAGWKDTDIYYRATKMAKNVRAPHKSRDRGRIINFRSDHARKSLFVSTILGSLTFTARGIAYDDSNRDFLDNFELERILAKVTKKMNRKIDILGMDACLMAMIEVSYQNKEYIDYVIASEENEPGDGWPYDLIIKKLNEKPEMDADEFSRKIVQEYIKSYQGRSDVTQSSMKTAVLEELATSVSKLAVSLSNNLDNYESQIKTIYNEVLTYRDWDYVDLKDFAELVKKYIPNEASIAEEVIKNIDKVVVEAGGNGAGISIYLPYSNYSRVYNNLHWAKK